MKDRLRILLKFFLVTILLVTFVTIAALVWPMPAIPLPEKHESVLIRSINIIDIKSGEILMNRYVLIRGNRIVSIDSVQPSNLNKGTFIVDGKEKYLIPGLWDMHTHSTQHSQWLHHPLYIANGVTAIRDMSGQMGQKDSYWAGTADRMKWNERLQIHQQVTPRYVLHSSYQMNGINSVPSDFSDYFKLESEEDVPLLLSYYQQEGADFIKVYSEIPPHSYRELLKRSSNYNLHVAGHKPLGIPLEEAIIGGQRSFEHGRIFMFDCYPGADSLIRGKDKRKIFRNSMESMVDEFDVVKAEYLMELMRDNDSHWVPTLQTVKISAFADKDSFLTNPNLEYILILRKLLIWDPDIKRSAKDNRSEARSGLNLKFYQAIQKQVGLAHQKGVPMMTGTDVTDTYCFPGFSLHEELEDLTRCGLSNLEALQSATIVPARYCKLENQLGSIDKDKIADLIILSENPLALISNTKKIDGVILNGVYYDKEALRKLKSTTKSLASSFHMNIKFVFSLFGSPLMRKQFAD